MYVKYHLLVNHFPEILCRDGVIGWNEKPVEAFHHIFNIFHRQFSNTPNWQQHCRLIDRAIMMRKEKDYQDIISRVQEQSTRGSSKTTAVEERLSDNLRKLSICLSPTTIVN